MSLLIHVWIMCLFVSYVRCQADLSKSYTLDKMPLQDKALYLADFLYNHPTLFRKLLKISDAAKPLLDTGGDDPKISFLFDVGLEKLPDVMNSSDTYDILSIIADELNRVDVTDVVEDAKNRNLPHNTTEYQQNMTDAIAERFNTMRTVQRVLTHRSVRDYLPLVGSNISTGCYDDMMTLIDATFSVQHPPRENLNFTAVPWAWRILDAYGKPPSGILDGELNWDGSESECRHVHAHLEQGIIVGNESLSLPVKFQGKYCQVDFNVSTSTVLADLVETGEKILSWGVCVPDTCNSNDVIEMFQLGVVAKLNLNPENVNCEGENKLSTDHTMPTTPASTTLAADPDAAFTRCAGGDARLDQNEWKTCFFYTFDTNKNGVITKDEWKSEYTKLGLADSDSTTRYFMMLDTNKNLELDDVDFRYFFFFFDDNRDGAISFEEYTFNWISLFSQQLR